MDSQDQRDRGRFGQVFSGAKPHAFSTFHMFVWSLRRFFQGFNKFGFNVDESNNIIYREWAPNAVQASLIGDFSENAGPRCLTIRTHLA
jgi:1,4-alpha-glucan branching enzyme